MSKYKDQVGREFTPIKLRETEGYDTLSFILTSFLKLSFSNVKPLYSPIFTDKKEMIIADSTEKLVEAFDKNMKEVPAYGVTDLAEREEDILSVLFENYPELHLLQYSNKKFIIQLQLAVGSFRFHKNGGYRGKDSVSEHVAESPSDSYLCFHIHLVQE